MTSGTGRFQRFQFFDAGSLRLDPGFICFSGNVVNRPAPLPHVSSEPSSVEGSGRHGVSSVSVLLTPVLGSDARHAVPFSGEPMQ
jgi:hypothetical protein